MASGRSPQTQIFLILGSVSLVSLGFFGYGAYRNHSFDYSYLIWNLFLAWLPLLFAMRLSSVLDRKLWSSWEGLFFSLLWLVFLPNSFYMISDFIHLQDVGRVDILYDTVMFTSFIYVAAALGFTSLFIVHIQLKRRVSDKVAAIMVGLTMVLCSLAVYIGRDLRWNSWDILTNPGGLLFDVSDRLQHPTAYPQMYVTVVSFSILLISMYWLLIKIFRLQHNLFKLK